MDAFIVSLALDTNGQNARYTKAAARYGGDPRITSLIIGQGHDPAGVASRFQAAAAKGTELRIRSAHRKNEYFKFPGDILWDNRTEKEVERLFREADVVHLNNSYAPYRRLKGPRLKKPALLHHHGTMFRNGPDRILRWARRYGMVQAVSTIDLLRIAPDELTWLPTAYDVDDLARRRSHRADGRILVVSCPTNRSFKSTDLLIKAIAALQAEGLPVDLELVEGQPWEISMARKARADIYFDQVILGYGCNAIEAWGMGIPVVAGADEWTLGRMLEEYGRLPFYAATEASIADRIRDLVVSSDLRAEWGQAGLAHVRRFHDELPALERLVTLYLRAMGHRMAIRKAAAPNTSGGRFESTVYPNFRIRLGDTPVQFRGGRLELGPDLAWQLRERLAAKAIAGISELGLSAEAGLAGVGGEGPPAALAEVDPAGAPAAGSTVAPGVALEAEPKDRVSGPVGDGADAAAPRPTRRPRRPARADGLALHEAAAEVPRSAP